MVFNDLSQIIQVYSQSIRMLQLKKQNKQWTQKANNGSTSTHKFGVPVQEIDLPIKRDDLSKILEQFAMNEEQLLKKISDLEDKNRELRSIAVVKQSSQHQIERYRHLLSIKEQLIIAQQKEIQELKNTLKKSQIKQSQARELLPKVTNNYCNSNQEQELNELSKIQSIDEYDSSEKENRGFETKRKICLKKSVKSIKNNLTFKTLKNDSLNQETQKLQIARLRSEVSRLQSVIEGLRVQMQIADIQTEHLSRDCDIVNRRERRLQQTLMRALRDQDISKVEQESALSQKCQMLERYIDKLTEKVERIDHPQLHPLPSRKFQEIPPPITPHFSSGTAFVFPNMSRKTPTKLQSPAPDQIFEACQQENQQQMML